MFKKKQKEETQEIYPELKESLKQLKIHTMPEKFLTGNLKTVEPESKSENSQKIKKPEKGNSHKKFLLIIIGLGLILTISAALVFFFVFRQPQAQLPVIREEAPPARNQLEEPPAVEEPEEEPPELAEEPQVEPPLEPVLEQRVETIYDAQGQVISEAVFSFDPSGAEPENISLQEFAEQVSIEEKYLEFITGKAYFLDLKGETLLNPSILTISYSPPLAEQDLSELKIGYLVMPNEEADLEIEWLILEQSRLDEDLGVLTVVLAGLKSGIYAIVPKDVNQQVQINYPPEEPETEEEEIFYESSEDTDSDGLTDEEEKLYQTDPALPDTDLDGYLDGVEILRLYNPAASEGSLLLENSAIGKYENQEYNYTIFYPVSWQMRPLQPDSLKELIWNSEIGEFVTLTIQDNPAELSLQDWYLLQAPQAGEAGLEQDSFEDKDILVSPNKMTMYQGFLDKVYVFSYDAGLQDKVNYKTTFKMMVRSFTLAESPLGSNDNYLVTAEDFKNLDLDVTDFIQTEEKTVFPSLAEIVTVYRSELPESLLVFDVLPEQATEEVYQDSIQIAEQILGQDHTQISENQKGQFSQTLESKIKLDSETEVGLRIKIVLANNWLFSAQYAEFQEEDAARLIDMAISRIQASD